MFSGVDVGHRSAGDGHDIGIVFGLQRSDPVRQAQQPGAGMLDRHNIRP